MRLSRSQIFVLIAVIVVMCIGVLGSMWAYSEELQQQMHGVEPGPEAARALVWQAVYGFVGGVMLGTAAVGALFTLVSCLPERKGR